MSIDLRQIGTKGFKIFGAKSEDRSGQAVSAVGDVNKDGIDDLIIGAPNASPLGRTNAGAVHVIFGQTKNSNVSLVSIDSSRGFRIIGAKEGDSAGSALSSIIRNKNNGPNDANDIIIGAPNSSPLGRINAGATYIVSASTKVSKDIDLAISDDSITSLQGIASGDHSGYAVSSIDSNRIIIGAPNASSLEGTSEGIGYVTSNLLLSIQIQGAAAENYIGASVSGIGDINQDGFNDLIIGAPLASPLNRTNAGESYVIFGNNKGFLSLDSASLPTTNGFKIMGAKSGDLSGYSVKGGFDINKDGFSDIIIGAPNASPLNRTQAGEVYVLFGKKTGFTDIDLSKLTSSQGFKVMGEQSADILGHSVSGARDINKDGIDDIIIGAPNSSPLGRVNAGEAYVLYGKKSPFNNLDLLTLTSSQGFKVIGEQEDDLLGYSVSDAGDLNKDGFNDLIIGAPGASSYGNDRSGTSYAIFGSGIGAHGPEHGGAASTDEPSSNWFGDHALAIMLSTGAALTVAIAAGFIYYKSKHHFVHNQNNIEPAGDYLEMNELGS